MPRFRSALALALAGVLALPAVPAFPAPLRFPAPVLPGLLPYIPVQSYDREGYSPEPRGSESRETLSEEQKALRRVTRFIRARVSECRRYTEIWRIDCLADALQQASRAMPDTPAYAKARKDIAAAAGKLQRIAERNADPKVPAKVRRADSGRSTARPIVAIRPEALPAANARAEDVVAGLTTTLLRSAATATAADPLTEVASAVDSSLVLLRSS